MSADEIDEGHAAASAGGVPTIKNAITVLPPPSRTEKANFFANQYPGLAKQIRAAEQQEQVSDAIKTAALVVGPELALEGVLARGIVISAEEAGLQAFAREVLAAGGIRQQTVSVLRTEGPILVGGGVTDLNAAQRQLVISKRGIPVRLPGLHAEGTLELRPEFGVAKRPICWVCERDIVEGAFGHAGEWKRVLLLACPLKSDPPLAFRA